MDCKVTCLGRAGSSFTYIINDVTYRFKGGASKTVDIAVGDLLKTVVDTSGSSLFSIEVCSLRESNGLESVPDVIDKDLTVSVNERADVEVPVSAPVKPLAKSTKMISKKKQGKLI